MSKVRPRVRTDQPTTVTLEEAMLEARGAALACLKQAGFYDVQIVLGVVATSVDPDDDVTTWACATSVPAKPDPLLVRGLRLSAEEAAAAGQ